MANIKVNSKILLDDVPYQVLRLDHIKVARWGATDKAALKNILTGAIIQHTFHDINKIKFADISTGDGEYLYSDGEEYHFMDTETYDQFSVGKEKLGDVVKYLTDGCKVLIQSFNGNPINIDLEPSVELEVESTPPGEKGDTATGGKKPATMKSGLVVQVPLFIKAGDVLKIDTRTGDYLSRA